MELRPLADDVYACLQEDRGLGCSNSGLIRRGGGLVVDTFWDLPHTRELARLYATVCPDPIRRVVNTHHNGDHCWGNQLFAGAEIIGHRLCAALFRKESPAGLQAIQAAVGHENPAIAGFAKSLAEWDFRDIELTPPTTVFDERLDLDLDGIAVALRYVGPAHTAGDVVAFLPDSRILFTGDILFRLCTPIGWEGTFDRWLAALDELAGLEPETVVPGHGPICGPEGLREQARYLAYVREEAKAFFEAGVPAVEAARRIDLGPFADWTEPERVVFNLERAYRELRGDAWDADIDVAALFADIGTLRLDPAFPRRA